MPRRPPAPSALSDHLGFWMRRVSNQVSGEFRRAVEAMGVSVSEWVALRHLHDGPCTHAELVAGLHMTKGAVSKVCRSLEDKNLLARRPDEQDGRSEALVLTAAGRALVPRLAAAADANEERFFGQLPPARRAELRELLEAIARQHGIDETPVQ